MPDTRLFCVQTFRFMLRTALGTNAPAEQKVEISRDGYEEKIVLTAANLAAFDRATAFAGARSRKKRRTGAPGKQPTEYAKLNDLHAHKDKKSVNVWGVVIDYSFPRPTGGTDWLVTLTIADELCPAGVSVSLFYDAQSLPKIQAVGDVVRLKRVKVGEWEKNVQLTRAPGHHVCVWSRPPPEGEDTLQRGKTSKGEDEMIWKPYHCAMINSPAHAYEAAAEDLDTVRKLSLWSEAFLRSQPAADSRQNEYAQRLSGATELDKPFDLFCRITRPPRAPERPGDPMWFGVWDGTRVAAVSAPGGAAARGAEAGQQLGETLRVCVEGVERDLVRFMTGTVAHIERGQPALRERFQPGCWAKLRNLRLRKVPREGGGEDVVGFLANDRAKKIAVSVMVVPEYHFGVVGLSERYDKEAREVQAGGKRAGAKGKASGDGAQTFTIVSSAGFAAVPTSTVADVLAQTARDPVGKFRLRVEMRDLAPRVPADFLTYSLLLKRWNVGFKITLSDPTGSITAMVANEEFEEFTGVSAVEMNTAEGQAKCGRALEKLEQPNLRSEVCLKTHFDTKRQVVQYWVFATRLLDSPRPPLPGEESLYW